METFTEHQNESIDNQPATSPEALAWSADKDLSTTPIGVRAAMKEVARQRDTISYTADRVRKGEITLDEQESHELGRHALSLAMNTWTDPAVAEQFMVDYAASVKTPDAIVGAYHVINKRFEKSSDDHRQASRRIAARAITLTNRDITPTQAYQLAQEQTFEEQFGNTSEETLGKMLELTRLFHTFDKLYEDLDAAGDSEHDIRTGTRLINTTFTLLDQIRGNAATNSRADLSALMIAEATVKRLEAVTKTLADTPDNDTIRRGRSAIEADMADLESEVDGIIEQAPADLVEDYEQARHVANDPELFKDWFNQHVTADDASYEDIDSEDYEKAAA